MFVPSYSYKQGLVEAFESSDIWERLTICQEPKQSSQIKSTLEQYTVAKPQNLARAPCSCWS
jgi:hypothetical protein